MEMFLGGTASLAEQLDSTLLAHVDSVSLAMLCVLVSTAMWAWGHAAVVAL